MKKGMALVLSLVMIMACGMTVCAKESASATQVATVGTASVSTVPETIQVAGATTTYIADPAIATNLAALLNSAPASYGVTGSVRTVSVVDVQGTIPAGGKTLTFTVTSASAGDTVVVLHYENGAWVKVGSGVLGADKTVSGFFTSLSPVAFIVENGTSSVAAATGISYGYQPIYKLDANGVGYWILEDGTITYDLAVATGQAAATTVSAGLTSPKTGVTSMIYLVEIMGIFALAGGAVCAKRYLAK